MFNNKKTLYVTDMDGTLLSPDSRVSTKSASIISELSRAGALITVATARTPATVEPLLADTYTVLPAIVMTGATLWDRVSASYVDTAFIDSGTASQISRYCASHGVHPFTYALADGARLNVYHDKELSDGELKFVSERQALPLKKFILNHPDRLNAAIPNTIMYFALGEKKRIFELADELRLHVDCSVSSYIDIFGKDTGIIEIFARRVSKAEAVRKLAERVNAGRIVVFGDNLNDIPMLQTADVAVAVGNALDEVKAVADKVIDANHTDAVARYIAEDFTR